jgi:multidrug resistance efflux pump
MTSRRFIGFIVAVFLIALGIYFFTTPKGSDIQLIGIVDDNEVILSPQITGRIVKLTVDEDSEVKKGELIVELDRKELEAIFAAA